MGQGIATINTVLKCAGTKLCKIKTYPDLGGAPELLETTDLEDISQTFTTGVQSIDAMEFTANYTKTAYEAVLAAADGTTKAYELDMGEDGADGKFYWSGTHTVRVTGGDVNAVREMVITCIPSTAITNVAPSGNTP